MAGKEPTALIAMLQYLDDTDAPGELLQRIRNVITVIHYVNHRGIPNVNQRFGNIVTAIYQE
jgi:hypothetical protein